jgi:hypothetical protein
MKDILGSLHYQGGTTTRPGWGKSYGKARPLYYQSGSYEAKELSASIFEYFKENEKVTKGTLLRGRGRADLQLG